MGRLAFPSGLRGQSRLVDDDLHAERRPLHDELVRKGAIIKLPPTDMPWGLREMQVADPDGNVLRFDSAIEE